MPAGVTCPSCGSTGLDAWWREPVSYNGHFTINDDAEPDFACDEAGVVGEGGDLQEYLCGGCSTILAVDGGALVARGRVLMLWLEVQPPGAGPPDDQQVSCRARCGSRRAKARIARRPGVRALAATGPAPSRATIGREGSDARRDHEQRFDVLRPPDAVARPWRGA